MFKVGAIQQRMNPVTGQRFVVQEIMRTPEKNPFRKRQCVVATITLEPATFTKKAVVKVERLYDDFMSVVCKMQAKYPGKNISYRSVSLTPKWAEEERERKKKESAPSVSQQADVKPSGAAE